MIDIFSKVRRWKMPHFRLLNKREKRISLHVNQERGMCALKPYGPGTGCTMQVGKRTFKIYTSTDNRLLFFNEDGGTVKEDGDWYSIDLVDVLRRILEIE